MNPSRRPGCRRRTRFAPGHLDNLVWPLNALSQARSDRGALELRTARTPALCSMMRDGFTKYRAGLTHSTAQQADRGVSLITANVAATARDSTAAPAGDVFRIHDEPSIRAGRPARHAAGFGSETDPAGKVNAVRRIFNSILARVRGEAHEPHRHEIVAAQARCRRQYNPENVGHFGVDGPALNYAISLRQSAGIRIWLVIGQLISGTQAGRWWSG